MSSGRCVLLSLNTCRRAGQGQNRMEALVAIIEARLLHRFALFYRCPPGRQSKKRWQSDILGSSAYFGFVLSEEFLCRL